jgi:hypothetical protein
MANRMEKCIDDPDLSTIRETPTGSSRESLRNQHRLTATLQRKSSAEGSCKAQKPFHDPYTPSWKLWRLSTRLHQLGPRHRSVQIPVYSFEQKGRPYAELQGSMMAWNCFELACHWGHSLQEFIDTVHAVVPSKSIINAVYSFEQKGTTHDTLGSGYHAHLVVEHTLKYRGTIAQKINEIINNRIPLCRRIHSALRHVVKQHRWHTAIIRKCHLPWWIVTDKWTLNHIVSIRNVVQV